MHNSQQLACFLTLLNWTFISVKYDPSKIVSILKRPKFIETFSIFYHINLSCQFTTITQIEKETKFSVSYQQQLQIISIRLVKAS